MTEPREIPSAQRLERQAESLRSEADQAKSIGALYDMDAAEFELLLEQGDIREENSLAVDVRYFFADRDDVLDPGSADMSFIERLGPDVCLRPDLLEAAIGVAKIHKKADAITTDDILAGWDVIERGFDEKNETESAANMLLGHGAEQDEVVHLLAYDPRTLRRYARLLEAPILVGYKERLFNRFADSRQPISLENMIGVAMSLIQRYNRLQEALEAGDEQAIRTRQDLLASPRYAAVADEIAEMERPEHEAPEDDED